MSSLEERLNQIQINSVAKSLENSTRDWTEPPGALGYSQEPPEAELARLWALQLLQAAKACGHHGCKLCQG